MSIVIIVVCVAVIAVAAALAGYTFGASRQAATVPAAVITAPMLEDATAAQIPIEIIEPPPSPVNSIAVPGFERLTVRGRMLDAGNVHNPERNKNYFIVSIMLADGTKIFRSGVLAPGQSIGTVELPNAIPLGIHDGAIARYSAFSLDDLSPLNGADVNFTLEVLP